MIFDFFNFCKYKLNLLNSNKLRMKKIAYQNFAPYLRIVINYFLLNKLFCWVSVNLLVATTSCTSQPTRDYPKDKIFKIKKHSYIYIFFFKLHTHIKINNICK